MNESYKVFVFLDDDDGNAKEVEAIISCETFKEAHEHRLRWRQEPGYSANVYIIENEQADERGYK